MPGLKGCIGGQELLTVNPDGRITPCLMNDTLLGNYQEWGSIRDFYNNSDELNHYLSKIQNNSECNLCEIYEQCRGGCQVRKIVEYRDITGRDPYCPKNLERNDLKEITEIKEITKFFKTINVFHSL
ncbi:pyrroloquinoline quinone biosynthesis protein PqqE [compost metagenome]